MSNKTPPTILELKPFEEDVLKLLENIKFRDTKNHFQETFANDLQKINSSDKIFVFADKTRNKYETSLDTYNKLLHDNITKTYKHGSEDNISEINSLYRDDGLAIIKNKSARLADKARKELHKAFEQFGLKITAESNLNVVNFLDVTFDLSTGKYKPYTKPNDDPLYINKHSNYPPSILRQLPTSITSAFQHFHLTSKHLRTQHQHIRTH